MTTTLVKNPLRTSLSMLTGHDFDAPLPVSHEGQPFGYLYANWNPGTTEEIGTTDDPGYYDEDAQVWVTADGGITMGVYTKTRTGGCPGSPDCVTDDVCA